MKQLLEIKNLLLTAPDGHLDKCTHSMIEAWGKRPTAIQALELLDHCIAGALASEFTIRLLQLTYSNTLDSEMSTHEEIVKRATWRDQA